MGLQRARRALLIGSSSLVAQAIKSKPNADGPSLKAETICVDLPGLRSGQEELGIPPG